MKAGVRIAAVLGLAAPLGGCIAAAALPALASSAMVRQQLKVRAERKAPEPQRASVRTEDGQRLTLVGGMLPAPDGGAARGVAPMPAPGTVPDTMRYLYGSGEAAALSQQAYAALVAYVAGPVAYTRTGKQRQMVLAEGATLEKPYFELCGEKQKAVVLDIDETSLLNLGYEGAVARTGESYDAARWSRWEATGADKVVAVPGVKSALDALRKAGVVVIFNSNRGEVNAEATERALAATGLGPAKHGENLFLRGDDGAAGSGKDVRRWAITSGYCVVAMVGDQLGDFSDLFNDPSLAPAHRRALAASKPFAEMWGNGWFLLPNPVYGPGITGRYDDVFPQDTRWEDRP